MVEAVEADPSFAKLTVGVLEIVLEKLTEGVGVLVELRDPIELIDEVAEPDTVEVGVLDLDEEALFEIEPVFVAVIEPNECELLTEGLFVEESLVVGVRIAEPDTVADKNTVDETDLLGDGVLEATSNFGTSPHTDKSVMR